MLLLVLLSASWMHYIFFLEMLIIEIDVTLCYLLDDILLVDDEYGYVVVILSLYCCCHIIMLMRSILVVGSYHSFAIDISLLPTC